MVVDCGSRGGREKRCENIERYHCTSGLWRYDCFTGVPYKCRDFRETRSRKIIDRPPDKEMLSPVFCSAQCRTHRIILAAVWCRWRKGDICNSNRVERRLEYAEIFVPRCVPFFNNECVILLIGNGNRNVQSAIKDRSSNVFRIDRIRGGSISSPFRGVVAGSQVPEKFACLCPCCLIPVGKDSTTILDSCSAYGVCAVVEIMSNCSYILCSRKYRK